MLEWFLLTVNWNSLYKLLIIIKFIFFFLKHYFATELLNFAKRDPEMQQETDVVRKMPSLMSWPNSCHYPVPLHPSWTRLPLCDLQSVTWIWNSLVKEVRLFLLFLVTQVHTVNLSWCFIHRKYVLQLLETKDPYLLLSI